MKRGIECSENPMEEKYNVGEILELPPAKLVDFLVSLDKQGKLESFMEMASSNDSLVAQMSYWEKWLQKDHASLLDDVIAKKKNIYPGEKDALPLNLDKRFNEQELQIIFSNVAAIQLTFGCSKGCPFCGLDAVKGVREHIAYGQLENIFQRYGELIGENDSVLYWASEPSDYASRGDLEDKTYKDVQQLAEHYADYTPPVTSREFNNKEWLEFLAKSGDERLSVYGLSDERKKEIKKMVGGQIELVGANKNDEHLRGIGISSQKYNSESGLGIGWCKDGIVITPRGIYNVLMVFISKKYPQGEIVVPIESIGQVPQKGESLDAVLRHCIVKHYERSFPSSSNRIVCAPLNAPAVRIIAGGEEYDVAVDRNGRVRKTLPVNKELDELSKRREDISNEYCAFNSGADKNSLGRELEEIEEKIEPLVYARIEEYENYNLTIQNIFAAGSFSSLSKKSNCFVVQQDEENGDAYLKIVDVDSKSAIKVDMDVRELNSFLGFEVFSQTDARLKEFLGRTISIEEAEKLFGDSLLFKLATPRRRTD